MDNKEKHYVVYMNFTFENLTEAQRDAIAERLSDLLDEEFTEDWMMTSTADEVTENGSY